MFASNVHNFEIVKICCLLLGAVENFTNLPVLNFCRLFMSNTRAMLPHASIVVKKNKRN